MTVQPSCHTARLLSAREVRVHARVCEYTVYVMTYAMSSACFQSCADLWASNRPAWISTHDVVRCFEHVLELTLRVVFVRSHCDSPFHCRFHSTLRLVGGCQEIPLASSDDGLQHLGLEEGSRAGE